MYVFKFQNLKLNFRSSNDERVNKYRSCYMQCVDKTLTAHYKLHTSQHNNQQKFNNENKF